MRKEEAMSVEFKVEIVEMNSNSFEQLVVLKLEK